MKDVIIFDIVINILSSIDEVRLVSGQRIIYQADLRTIEGNLTNLSHSVEHVYHYVMDLQNKMQNTDQKLEKLSNDFYSYLQSELKMKQLQLAETRLIRVRQKVAKEFGHYDEVRRRATGILQAVDAGIVPDQVINQVTEELMISTPKYWLAPCLVALSAWISDNRELAEQALQEAIKRDNEKTALFFALVTRRSERLEASNQWLERYFQLQDPFALDREVIILVDAFSNGVFVPGARKRCEQQMQSWYNDISQIAGENHLGDWSDVFNQFIPHTQENSYVYLEKYSPNWSKLERSLNQAKSHARILSFFQEVYAGSVEPVRKVSEAVDQILTRLMTGFDDEELPVREEDRRLSLIIDAEGDLSEAEQKFSNEQTAWQQKFHFKDMLKTLSFAPQAVQATKATQRFAIAFSKEWVKKAYQDYTANHRLEYPTEIELKIQGWTGKTRDGSNQVELVHSLLEQMEKEAKKNNPHAKVGKKHWIAAGMGALISAVGIGLSFFFPIGYLLFFLGLLGPAWLVLAQMRANRAYDHHKKQVQEEAKNRLLACLAEVVDWRREYEQEDKKYEDVINFIDSIQKEQYIEASFDQARAL